MATHVVPDSTKMSESEQIGTVPIISEEEWIVSWVFVWHPMIPATPHPAVPPRPPLPPPQLAPQRRQGALVRQEMA